MSDVAILLSIIIPARNAARTIDACLASIESQRILRLEVLVVNDGSSDNTSARAARGRAFLPVTVFDLPRGIGASAARNGGLAKAAGKWVSFVDADDTLIEGAFAGILAEADRTGADLVVA